MKLLTKEILRQLQKNEANNNDEDIAVKFFNPCGAATWLITRLDPDGDTLWGLCDLGMDCVEYGTVSLKELESTVLRFGLKIERDLHFKGGKVSDFADRNSLAGC